AGISPGFRRVEPADRWLQLRHIRRGSSRADYAARAEGLHSGWILYGRRRDRSLLRTIWVERYKQGGHHRRRSSVLAKDARQPRGRGRPRIRGDSEGSRCGPLCIFHGVLQKLLQHKMYFWVNASVEHVVQASWNIAAGAWATASLACVPTWHEDFRADLAHRYSHTGDSGGCRLAP